MRLRPVFLITVLATAAPFFSLVASGQTKRPDAAVAPISVLGNVTEVTQRIILNSFRAKLSKSYQLVSSRDYKKAEEAAFQELDLARCTAEECIRKIQEILQVERLFVLQVLREENFTQLSLTLARLERSWVETAECENCSISQLNGKVAGLVGAVIGSDLGKPPVVRSILGSQAGPAVGPTQPQQTAIPSKLQAIAVDTWRDPVTGMEFVKVSGGSFEMGCHVSAGQCRVNEKPSRAVRLDGFWLGKHEVTQGQWEKIMSNNTSSFKKGDNYPMEMVSWDEAQGFIRKLNAQSSASFGLPSEAQWEYACRAGGKSVKYGTGDGGVLSTNANYKNNNGGTTPVGAFPANDLDLHDMSGNVWEWVADKYTKDYGNVGTNNPIYEGSGARRVIRGGSWDGDPRRLRCSFRYTVGPSYGSSSLGFRLVRIE